MTYENIYTKFMIEYDKANITSSYPSLTKYEVATILDKAYLALIGQKVSGNNLRRSTIESDIKSISDIQSLIDTDSCEPLLDQSVIPNRRMWKLPELFLYFVAATLQRNEIYVPMKLVSHESAQKFFQTEYNMPWVKIPACYIEGDKLFSLDESTNEQQDVKITYVRRPVSFVNCDPEQEFECNDSMAEELISLAVTFALENIESSRLTTKLNTRGLEA